MAEITSQKKKKRTLNLPGFTIVFCALSLVCYLISCLFLRSYNNSLSKKVQEFESKTAVLLRENDALRVDIQTLSTRDRVVGIAEDAGLSLDQTNIVTITETEN